MTDELPPIPKSPVLEDTDVQLQSERKKPRNTHPARFMKSHHRSMGLHLIFKKTKRMNRHKTRISSIP
eukprot:UN33307